MRRDDSLVVRTDDHELRGVCVRGKWRFGCDSWPALAARHEGAASPDEIVREFLGRALGVALVPLEAVPGGVTTSYEFGVTPSESVGA